MSNEMIQVPDWLKAMGEQPSDGSSLVSAVASVPRVSLNGKIFKFKDGEEEYKVKDECFVIILGAQPESGLAKTYYKMGYNPDSTEPPTCSSSDGIRPDSWVTEKQADICSQCHNNQWGSAKSMSGGKAKACRESKRLIVVDAKKGMESTAYILNVTVKGLKALTNYGKQLIKLGVPMSAVITRLTFEEESSVPILQFDMKMFLNEKLGKQAIERASKREWEEFDGQAIAHQQSESSGKLPPPGTQAQRVESQPAQAEPAQPVEQAQKEPESVEELLGQW